MKKIIALTLIVLTFLNTSAHTPTWTDGIACIVYSHCSSCHNPKGIANFSLMNYNDVYQNRLSISSSVSSKKMPPFPASTDKRSYAHSNTLSAHEIEDIVNWVANDAPLGNANAIPVPPIYNSNIQMTNPDVTLSIPKYSVNTSNDLYRCFVLNPNVLADKNIESIEIIPGDKTIVHHVLVYQDTSGVSTTMDNADPQPGYTSFGGIGTNSAILISGYVPGQSMMTYPTGFGPRLLKNAKIVLQIHYPGGLSGKIDSTQIRIKYRTTVVRDLSMDPILNHLTNINQTLYIPANTIKTFVEKFTIPSFYNITVTGILPHMHLIGKSIKSFVVTPNNDTIPLVDISNWDFHWQYFYTFQKPLKLTGGSTIYAVSQYDNTTQNLNNPNSPPKDVQAGEATTDEMMLIYFNYTGYQPNDELIVVDTSSHFPHDKSCSATSQLYSVKSTEISIYPNPCSNLLFFDKLNPQEIYSLELYNTMGEKVYQNSKIQSNSTLDISPYSKGIYLMKITDSKNYQYQHKLTVVD